jgi:hypothetical protein
MERQLILVIIGPSASECSDDAEELPLLSNNGPLIGGVVGGVGALVVLVVAVVFAVPQLRQRIVPALGFKK